MPAGRRPVARGAAQPRALMPARLGKPSILEALPATAEIGPFVRLALAGAGGAFAGAAGLHRLGGLGLRDQRGGAAV